MVIPKHCPPDLWPRVELMWKYYCTEHPVYAPLYLQRNRRQREEDFARWSSGFIAGYMLRHAAQPEPKEN